MNPKAGCLRRVALLLAFAWAFNRFVLDTDHFVPDPLARKYLFYLLAGATAWGIAHLFADRLRITQTHRRKENEHANNDSRPD